jgi:hypothetical protein
MYIFRGVAGWKPFQFVVLARTEGDARRRLLETVKASDYHEFQGCYAPSAQDVFNAVPDKYGATHINYCPLIGEEWVKAKNFEDFVLNTKVTVKNPTPVLFSSCLDG